jgi:membrane protein YdbS with pleckstrin-like domain
MAYIDEILEPGEKVVFKTSLSWTVYGPAIVYALLALALTVLSTTVAGLGVIAIAIAALAVLAALAALFGFLRGWFRRWTTEIAVTDRRVVLKRGFIRRHTVEMNMQKVESVDVDQTQLGRVFNYGTVTIKGTGSTLESLRMIDHPLKLRSAITAG